MRSAVWFGAALQLAQLVAAQTYTIDPPTEAPADTILDCTNWHVGAAGDKCEDLAKNNFIELAWLYRYNPSLADGCKIVEGTSYCVEENWGIPPPVTSTTTSSSSTKPSSTGLATPTPTQPGGMTAGCTKFYFVKKEDSCSSVLETNGLTLPQLFALNAGVKSDCSGLWLEVYLCVAGPPSSTTLVTSTTSSAASATGSNGIVTPTPTMPPGPVNNCNKFYFVPANTDCNAVLSTNGITLAQLFAWNSGVKSDCSGLWTGVYVCVGVIGGGAQSTTTTSKPPASTTSTGGNGIATPSPTMPPALVSNCNKFFFVESGLDCNAVLSRNSISLAQLFAWNSGVKSDCSGLWTGVYVCVGVIGGGAQSTTTTTSKPPVSSTSTGANGIATPSPTQPPSIVSNCNKFYFVPANTDCNAVLSRNGITLAQLFAWNSGVKSDCSGMWTGVHLCVGVIGGSPPPTSTTRTTSTTTRGNGVATPTPTQPGMVTNCKTFYKVVDKDDCGVISSKTGVSFANLQKWNTAIGASCNVWLGYYLCIAVL